MKSNYSLAQVLFLIIALFSFGETAKGQFIYLNPMPGSKYHNPQTALTIRNGDFIDKSSLSNKNWIEITGSKSGNHTWSSRLSDDRKTIVVKPQPIFDYGETVSVIIHSELKREKGKVIQGTSFSFQIGDEISEEQQKKNRNALHELYVNEFMDGSSQQSDIRDMDLDSLPTYTVTINNNAAPGEIFYNNQYDFDPSDTNCYNTIIENDGSLVYAKRMGVDGHDFKINYNGYLTYFNYTPNYCMIMDSNYAVFDSLHAGNGYEDETNNHDCSIYPDGHALVLISDVQMVNMTQYGGQPNAAVTSVIVQELDSSKDVVFEWSGWDHFQITDADSHVFLSGGIVDYVHANAVSLDTDGNILLSCRNMSEITKINRSTGDIIWRMGGENNQFTFINDNIPQHFAFQHDVRRCSNGNITLFNNGNYLPTSRSSAKEYQLDEVNKIATLVWYYEHPDVSGYPVFGPASGSVQRLPNGNTLIDWGTTVNQPARPSMTEVDYDKNITWEMTFDKHGQKSYRAHKYVWDPCAPVSAPLVKVKKITTNSAKVDWLPVNNATSYDLQYRKIGNSIWKSKNTPKTSKKLINLAAGKSYEFRLRTYCTNGYISDWTADDTFTTAPLRNLSERSSDVTIEIYPNPASDMLNVTFDSDGNQQTTISIYDLTGKLIMASTKPIPSGEQELSINISNLPAGYYLAQINCGEIKETRKFVKQ